MEKVIVTTPQFIGINDNVLNKIRIFSDLLPKHCTRV